MTFAEDYLKAGAKGAEHVGCGLVRAGMRHASGYWKVGYCWRSFRHERITNVTATAPTHHRATSRIALRDESCLPKYEYEMNARQAITIATKNIWAMRRASGDRNLKRRSGTS